MGLPQLVERIPGSLSLGGSSGDLDRPRIHRYSGGKNKNNGALHEHLLLHNNPDGVHIRGEGDGVHIHRGGESVHILGKNITPKLFDTNTNYRGSPEAILDVISEGVNEAAHPLSHVYAEDKHEASDLSPHLSKPQSHEHVSGSRFNADRNKSYAYPEGHASFLGIHSHQDKTQPALSLTKHASSDTAERHSNDQEVGLAVGVLLLLCLVLISMGLGRLLSKWVHRALSVPVVATLLGFVAGFAVKVSGVSSEAFFNRMINFNEAVFFVFILPPIIFASGFQLTGQKGALFFKRFGSILWFALFATLVSFLLSSFGFYLTGILRLSIDLTLQQSMALGALLSPTDPVTVLAMFRDMCIEPAIETVVMGESLLNDAVAILLYRVVVRGNQGGNPVTALLLFGVQFISSLGFGLLIGLIISYALAWANLKHSRHQHHDRREIGESRQDLTDDDADDSTAFAVATPRSEETSYGDHQAGSSLEIAVILLAPWICYLLAESVHLSGIVAVLFCGIAIARYGIHNFSMDSQITATTCYAAFSTVAETLVFLLLGFSVISFRVLWQPIAEAAASAPSTDREVPSYLSGIVTSIVILQVIFLHIFTVAYVSVVRAVSIFITGGIVNLLLRPTPQSQLPFAALILITLSGLRGAVAVALALKAKIDIGGSAGSAMVSATLVYTLFTILGIGPFLPTAVSCLNDGAILPLINKVGDRVGVNARSRERILAIATAGTLGIKYPDSVKTDASDSGAVSGNGAASSRHLQCWERFTREVAWLDTLILSKIVVAPPAQRNTSGKGPRTMQKF